MKRIFFRSKGYLTRLSEISANPDNTDSEEEEDEENESGGKNILI